MLSATLSRRSSPASRVDTARNFSPFRPYWFPMLLGFRFAKEHRKPVEERERRLDAANSKISFLNFEGTVVSLLFVGPAVPYVK